MSLDLEFHISETVSALKKGSILNFPSDTRWGFACSLDNHSGIHKLKNLQSNKGQKLHTLLVCDEFMLKKFVSKIHPRVDTLLHYYQRSLTVVHNDTMHLPANLLPETDKIGFRMVRNQFCEAVIHDLGTALYFLPHHLSRLQRPAESPEYHQLVDHEVPEECYDPLEERNSRIVSYDQKGMLIFHTEFNEAPSA